MSWNLIVSTIRELKSLFFDRILNSDEVRREIFFKDMATEDKNAFVEYNNSIRERQLAEEDKEIEEDKGWTQRKEGYVYDRKTDTHVRKNASNL